MSDPDGFVMEGDRGYYRPVGMFSFDAAITAVRIAITAACDHQALDLLVDTREMTGFSSPDTFQRFWAAVVWATEANGGLRLGLVALERMIDPQKFGNIVAANHGLVANIFSSEEETRAWLDSTRTSRK